MSIIEVNHVTKEYQLGQLQSLKTTALNQWRRLTGQPVEVRAPFKALNDVTFSIESGEVVGIIGHNGAGKSTMLKLLANISKPTSGSISVKGKVAPLIEVGAGLVGDLTGRENIYLNGAILGISKAEIKRKFDDIVAFAELEEFIDTPIKRYSSGMQVRLGFAVATSVESDILIVDEVLAVGDLAFQRKCFDRMEDLIKRQGKTVLLVSHNIRQVERLCERVILLNHGKVLQDGDASRVCNAFYERNDKSIKEFAKQARGQVETSSEIDQLDVSLLDEAGKPTDTVHFDSTVTVLIRIDVKSNLIKPVFGVGVHTTDFLYLASERSAGQLCLAALAPGVHEIRCRIEHFPLLPGVYSLRMSIAAGELSSEIFYGENLCHFQVIVADDAERSALQGEGFLRLNASWTIADKLASFTIATEPPVFK